MEGTYEASIEMDENDFEFAKPPLSLEFIKTTFHEHDIKSITDFGMEYFYVMQGDGDPMTPLYENSSYPPDIEEIILFMQMENIRSIHIRDGKIYRGAIERAYEK